MSEQVYYVVPPQSRFKLRTHRRASSVPPPLETETSSDEDMEQGIQNQKPKRMLHIESVPLMPNTCSEVSMSQSGSENSFISLIEVT